jgi:hypothetical protein
MKTRFCLSLSIAGTFGLFAQQPTPPPLPPGPLLNKAPDFAQWAITIKSAGTEKEEKASPSPEPSAKPSASGVYRIGVIKTGKVRHEVQAVGAQVISDIWSLDGTSVSFDPRTKVPQVSQSGSSAGSDFPGLEWISEKNYAGIKKVNGKDCIVFNDMVFNVRPNGTRNEFGGKVNAVAYVDLETRFPVTMQRGEDTYAYQFGAPPQAMLAAPPEVTQAVGAYQQRMNQLSTRGREP